jgi:hypothetical protein
MDWANVPTMTLVPDSIPLEYEVKGLNINTAGPMSLSGPNKIDKVTLEDWRKRHRLQELAFGISLGLTKHYVAQPKCEAPARVLFLQFARIVER